MIKGKRFVIEGKKGKKQNRTLAAASLEPSPEPNPRGNGGHTPEAVLPEVSREREPSTPPASVELARAAEEPLLSVHPVCPPPPKNVPTPDKTPRQPKTFKRCSDVGDLLASIRALSDDVLSAGAGTGARRGGGGQDGAAARVLEAWQRWRALSGQAGACHQVPTSWEDADLSSDPVP